MMLARKGQFNAFMDEAFTGQSFTQAHLGEQLTGTRLKQTGTNARKNIVGRLPLENQGIDAGPMQQMAQQQAGRTGNNDDHLSAARCRHQTG